MDENMHYPTLSEVRSYADKGNLVPIYRSINADLETPVSAFLKVATDSYCYLLESVSGGERLGRYSFIGTNPYKVIKTGKGQEFGEVDPLILVQSEMDQFQLVPVPGLPKFHGGGVVYQADDGIRYFEPRVPPMPEDPQGLPESVFMFSDTLLVFDHISHDIKVVSHVKLDGDIDKEYDQAVKKIDALVEKLERPLELPEHLRNFNVSDEVNQSDIESNFTEPQYLQAVEKCVEYIYAGDVIQVVNSQRFSRNTSAHPFQINSHRKE